ncbi:Phospholipase D1 [Tilletia horrida]|nr:Phospholipase D1 [Tilletia horrida]
MADSASAPGAERAPASTSATAAAPGEVSSSTCAPQQKGQPQHPLSTDADGERGDRTGDSSNAPAARKQRPSPMHLFSHSSSTRGQEGHSGHGSNSNDIQHQDKSQQQEQSQQSPPFTPTASARWTALKQKLRDSGAVRSSSTGPGATHDSAAGGGSNGQQNAVALAVANLRRRKKDSSGLKSAAKKVMGGIDLTKELESGVLPVFLVKMAFERDEQSHRRIPVLLNHVKLRIADSISAASTTGATVFRIELEYGDGMCRWVVYRQLRDFINLHAHYRAAALRGFLGRPVGASDGEALDLPSFPKTSIPYFNRITGSGSMSVGGSGGGHGNGNGNGTGNGTAQHDGRDDDPQALAAAVQSATSGQTNRSKAEFARAQREALEGYILELIKRVMFRPEANRILRFFEMSALGISLASRGGIQGKQGYLRIMSSNASRKSQHSKLFNKLNIAERREPRWCIVRESYIVMVEQPDSLQVWDVFLMDNDFTVERPKRLYKQTLHAIDELAHGDCTDEEVEEGDALAAADAGGGVGVHHKHHHRKSESEDKDATLRGTHPKSKLKDTAALLTGGQFTDKAIEKEAAKDKHLDADGEVKKPHAKRSRRKASASAVAGVSNHTFYIKNAERKIKLVAPNERQMEQFIASIERISDNNIFCGQNRFDSTFPIRLNCSAQWLVDGRDYYWNASKALLMAKERIYIHDWWLSPEVYLRRPGRPKYRLDNILKKKAEQGVKIFVIIYSEVSNSFTPTDSGYTKHRLLDLHPNIYVQRSPNHIQVGQFFWAHHEKLLVVDEVIAFMGGFDLCFGRYDTAAHVLVDDAEIGKDEHQEPLEPSGVDPDLLGPSRSGEEAHIWPGQDYANERVIEWHTLSKPEQDLFARDKYPRMPWHDTGIQLVGQPARDLCRHFVQRWDYLLRIKNHTRIMPFLLPPPDFLPSELEQYGLMGKCEAQICRSAGPWSLGLNKVECSIQNAYLKAIQMSEHFVIENQFFVTSTVVEGTKIENRIGDALVSRIIKAHREGTPWRAIIVIPLIPGFPMPIDSADATSIRIIVQCQARSISRGQHSIFGRLRREGIDPEDYISFFSLRNWGKLRGGQLVTEQVYVHGKIMIVDDRLALIGSANINERSQTGSRDSELAVVIRDMELVDGKMAGQPFKVGPFAHSLRLRLMREHLGLDVDALEERELHEQDETTANAEGSARSSLNGDKASQTWSIDPAIFEDPLADEFYQDVWLASALKNTEIYRMVFKSVPDDTVTTWAQYKAFVAWAERVGRSAPKRASAHQDNLGQYGHSNLNEVGGDANASGGSGSGSRREGLSSQTASPSFAEKLLHPSSSERAGSRGGHHQAAASSSSTAGGGHGQGHGQAQAHGRRSGTSAHSSDSEGYAERKLEGVVNSVLPPGLQPARGPADAHKPTKPPAGVGTSTSGASAAGGSANGHGNGNGGPTPSAPGATDTFSDRELERMEALLEELQGNLVIHPTRFLEAEDFAGNFIFASDLLQSNMTFAVFA